MVKVGDHWFNPAHVTRVNPHSAVDKTYSQVYTVDGAFVLVPGTPDEVVVALKLATPGFSKDLPTPQTKVHKTVDQLLQEHPNLYAAVARLLYDLEDTECSVQKALANWDEARKL